MQENNQRRMLVQEAQKDAWEFLTDIFQDFVLIFQNLAFTKGKRRLLLYIILKTEGDLF